MQLSPTLRERFLANVSDTLTDRGCREWIGKSRTNGGYGQISIATGISKGAHVVSWFLEKGEWPKQCLLHQCDNKLCTTIEHLNEGTHKQNAKEAIERGLKVHKYGLDHHNGKLSDKQVAEIRRRRAAGEKLKPLAKEFKVSEALISQIATGKARK